jgi:nicotinamide mononucleotide transporter
VSAQLGVEIASVALGLGSVWLTVRENIWCWAVGSASNALFCWLLFRDRLWANLALNVLYIALNGYGWWQWLHGGAGRTRLDTVRRTGVATSAGLAAVSAAATVAAAWYLRHLAGSQLPWWDAATTVLSVAATWMLAKKLLENWWVWIVADVLYIGLYAHAHLYWWAGVQLVFIALSVHGLREWRGRLPAARPAAHLTVAP